MNHEDRGEINGWSGHQHHQCRSRREALHHQCGCYRDATRRTDIHGYGDDQYHQHLQQRLTAETKEELVGYRHLNQCCHDKTDEQAQTDVVVR